jgi:predicted membrane protein
MKKVIAAVLAVAGTSVIGWLAACHSFSTMQGPIEDNRVKGLIYYLPKGYIHITGDF